MIPSDSVQTPVDRCPPAEAGTRDTGLHISMRALLSIIAGLLVADAVKACVVALTAGAASTPEPWINVALALAGTLFVARVVTDNLLYYAAPDVKTKEQHYVRRVLLILLDLMSYAVCYAIVARITIASGANVLTTGAVRWMVIYATLVEILHATWCLIARYGLPNEDLEDARTRNEWLEDWFRISGASAVAGTVLSIFAWRRFHPGFEASPRWLAITALLVSLASVGAYLWAMQKHYGRLRAT